MRSLLTLRNSIILLTCIAFSSGALPALALEPPPQSYVMRFIPNVMAIAPPASQLELGGEFTMEAWVFVEKFQPWAYLLGKTDPSGGDPNWSYLLALSNDGRRVQLVQSTGKAGEVRDVQSPAELSLRTWTHIAGTLAGGRLRLFVNGVEVASAQSPGPPAPNPLPFGAGGCVSFNGGPNANFTGAMRQVRVWSRALSAGELKANAVKWLKGSEPGLLAYWPLDDGKGQAARDLGQNQVPLRRGLDPTPNWSDPGWIHSGVLDAGPFFELEGPFDVAPGCDNSTVPCLGQGAVIDFDSDGAPDLLLTRCFYDSNARYPYAPMLALRNDGTGHFTDVSAAVCPDARSRATQGLAVGDFNGDRRMDILVGDQGPDHPVGPGGQNHLLFQTADGRLEDVTAARVPLRNVFTHTVCAGDFTGDGLPDFFVGTIYTGSVAGSLVTGPRLYRNDGHGSFSRGTEGLPDRVLRQANNMGSVALDANMDGHLDLVIGGGLWEKRDTLLLNDGSGNLTLAPENALPLRDPSAQGGGAAGMHMTAGDLDGDGWPDLLYLEQSTAANFARLVLLLNNHDGTFRDASAQMLFDEDDPVADANFPRIADFNGDGRLDFVIGRNEWSGPKLLLNGGSGAFVDGHEFWPLARPSGNLLPADFDGDGDIDVVINGAMGPSIWLLRQVKAPDLALLRDDPRPPRRHLGSR